MIIIYKNIKIISKVNSNDLKNLFFLFYSTFFFFNRGRYLFTKYSIILFIMYMYKQICKKTIKKILLTGKLFKILGTF